MPIEITAPVIVVAPAIWITVHYTPMHSTNDVRERLVNMALCHRIERTGTHTLLAFGGHERSDVVYCDEQPHAVLRRINESINAYPAYLTPVGTEQEKADDE